MLFRRTGTKIIAAIDTNSKFILNTLVVVTPKVHSPNGNNEHTSPSVNLYQDLYYLLGLLNSEILNQYFILFLKSIKGVFSEIQKKQLIQLPIKLEHPIIPKIAQINKEISILIFQKGSAQLTHDDSVHIKRLQSENERLVQLLYGLDETDLGFLLNFKT